MPGVCCEPLQWSTWVPKRSATVWCEPGVMSGVCWDGLTFLTGAQFHLQLHSSLLPLIQVVFNFLQLTQDVLTANVVFRLWLKRGYNRIDTAWLKHSEQYSNHSNCKKYIIYIDIALFHLHGKMEKTCEITQTHLNVTFSL